MSLNRRDFLKIGMSSGVAYLSLSPFAKAANPWLTQLQNRPSDSPLRPVIGDFSNSSFNGDDPKRAHDRLWDKEAYIAARGGRPAVSETRDVVIVGGGVAGLSSAYLLRDQKPLLLEQDFQFGGNSRGEIYQQTPFSMGAAYLTVPEEGSALLSMLQTTGVWSLARHESEADARVYRKGQGFLSMWQGQLDAESAQIVDRISTEFQNILEQFYPEIPLRAGGLSRADLESLDQMTFEEWLKARFGELPVSVLEYFQLYCWSSMGGSIDEISAAQALNFLAAETAGIIAFPGGNSMVLKGIYDFLKKTLPANSLRSGTFVLDVSAQADGVQVVVETSEGNLKTIACRSCIMATPKYTVPYIVKDLEDDKKRLSRSIEYNAYVVANVLLNQKVSSPCFDAYALEGKYPETPGPMSPPKRAFADVCFANWASVDQGSRSILTVYRPFPYQGSKSHLFKPNAFGKVQSEILAGLQELLATLGIPATAVEGVRQTLWGHSLPVAEPGFFATKRDLIFDRPTGGRIFYANQDNYVNPSFESAFAAAERAASLIAALPQRS